MSFLHADEENMATLEELSAFIDCSHEGDEGEGGSSQYFSEDGQPPLILASNADVEGGHTQSDNNVVRTPQKKTPKRRRVRIGWSSSTGLQRRKRAELEFLRQHAKDLEVYLQQLKLSPRATFTSIKTECPQQWKKVAMAEVVKLLRSEEVNRALKAIISNQLQIHEALKNVL
ncbi:hypothetical protein V7S43_004141 [Phytophthora oleae]|uniref:BZIP domain-containing protein n=1 Tax=Phytophthora oleae TaxID=2107226 RepID=A0ABD3FX11_9STRA